MSQERRQTGGPFCLCGWLPWYRWGGGLQGWEASCPVLSHPSPSLSGPPQCPTDVLRGLCPGPRLWVGMGVGASTQTSSCLSGHLPLFISQTCRGGLPHCLAPPQTPPLSRLSPAGPAGRWACLWAPGPRPGSGWTGSPAPPCGPALLLPSPSLSGPAPLAPSFLAPPLPPLWPRPSHSWPLPTTPQPPAWRPWSSVI